MGLSRFDVHAVSVLNRRGKNPEAVYEWLVRSVVNIDYEGQLGNLNGVISFLRVVVVPEEHLSRIENELALMRSRLRRSAVASFNQRMKESIRIQRLAVKAVQTANNFSHYPVRRHYAMYKAVRRA